MCYLMYICLLVVHLFPRHFVLQAPPPPPPPTNTHTQTHTSYVNSDVRLNVITFVDCFPLPWSWVTAGPRNQGSRKHTDRRKHPTCRDKMMTSPELVLKFLNKPSSPPSLSSPMKSSNASAKPSDGPQRPQKIFNKMITKWCQNSWQNHDKMVTRSSYRQHPTSRKHLETYHICF